MPLDIIKKAMLTGLGLALRTKDELEEIAREYIKKGDLSENEGKKFMDDLHKRYDDAREKLEQKIEQIVKDLLKKADIATKDEINKLKKEVKKLQKDIEALKK